MKSEAQRVAIATHLFPQFPVFWENGELRYRHGERTGPTYDYLNDLNAMADAEDSLNQSEEFEYIEHLKRLAKKGSRRATAAERAEAFLRTLGLWREEKELAQ